MIKFIYLFLLFTLSLFSQTIKLPKFPNSGDRTKFIPKNWDILAEVSGDLNKDGKEDLVLVLKSQKEEDFPDSARILLVLLGKDSDNFQLFINSSKAILQKNEGGGMDDPFQEVKIDRGSILIVHYGGQWGYSHRFQFRNKDFYLIGETITTLNVIEDYMEDKDTNLITGKSITTITKEGKKKSTTTQLAKKPLKKLRDFNPREI